MLLVEIDNERWTFGIDDPRGNEIGLLRMSPFDEKHQLARRVRGAQDLLSFEASFEASGRIR